MTTKTFKLYALFLTAALLFTACSSEADEVDATEDAATEASEVAAISEDATADTGPDTALEDREGGNTLTDGPTNVGEHGPLSNADFDGNESVTREELDSFIGDDLHRGIGLIAFFEESDTNGDNVIDEDELAVVEPATAFDGTDADGDGQVTLEEADAYGNEEGRSYRAIGLSDFFDLVDTNGDDIADIDEIEAAHDSGLLARG